MVQQLWPVALVVLANCVYNITTKSTPSQANAFASLTVTYLTAAAASLALLLAGRGGGALGEFSSLNWTAPVLGLSAVGLEVGYIFLYRAGWKVNTGPLVANLCLAIALVFLGRLLFGESVTPRQITGIAICLVGLVLVSG
ncbi:MAG TPA: hypothetical protein IAC15_07960 [Candidatus Onthomonas avicola]|nr:hypothetical protein [Candidatus Onthomonas avicola]